MESVKIILLCITAAVGYGIAHDQITAHVCVEYFTIGHSPVFETRSPTLLAIGWGIIATWWVGLYVGIPLSFVARIGPRHKWTARDLFKPISRLLGCMAACALTAGVIGYWLVASGRLEPVPFVIERIETAKQAAFMGDWFAHLTSYAVGFGGGLVLMGYVLVKRLRQMAQNPVPSTP